MAEFSKEILTLTVLTPARTNELASAAATKIKEQIRKNDIEDAIKKTATRKYNKSSSSSSSKSSLPDSIQLHDRDQDEQEESSFDDDNQFQSDDEDDDDDYPELKGQFEDGDGYHNDDKKDDNGSSVDIFDEFDNFM